MAKHITDNDIKNIVDFLDEWDLTVRLTWEKLCASLQETLGLEFTRQTLQKYTRIKNAYKSVKEHASGKVPRKKRVLPSSLAVAAKKIAKLERENARLNKENDRLLEQFLVWEYNAHINGIKLAQLTNPLPEKTKN
jgi:hypothetical protein|tara:strand:- start:1545 stop:1952 length:408 start_codon:yes stop_codon:yes gene_type:complete